MGKRKKSGHAARKPYVCDCCGKVFVARRHPTNKKYCSRACYGDGMKGENNPQKRPEVRAKNAAAIQKKWLDPEYRAKGCAAWTPARKKKQSEAVSGDKNPSRHPAVRAKQSERWQGEANPTRRPDVLKKLSRIKRRAVAEGRHPMQQPEIVAKVVASHKANWEDPEYRANHSGKNSPRWMGGVSREPYAWEFNDELKEEVRRRDGYKCQLCGVPQAECKRRLTVHHGDYDKKNSDPVNLVALCPRCNSKVNFNRKRWTAFFQAMALDRDIAEMRHRKQAEGRV